jgi:hypothetical protein
MAGKVKASLPEPEIYTPERLAEILLTAAVDEEDYQGAREAVRDLGLDPDKIEHLRTFRL